MEVRDEAEGDDVCEQLRAAGIKCAVEPLPDANSFASIWAFQAPTVLMVLVNDSDLDKARLEPGEVAAFRPDVADGRELLGQQSLEQPAVAIQVEEQLVEPPLALFERRDRREHAEMACVVAQRPRERLERRGERSRQEHRAL